MSVQTMTAQQFLTEYSKGDVTVVDVRTPAETSSEYIEGSLALPISELDEHRFCETLKAANCYGGTVYLLCQSGRRAEMAIEKLQNHCDNTLIILEGGLNAIKAAGGPVTTGTRKVMSLERQVRTTAGFMVLIGVILGFTIATPFFYLSAFVGAGLMFAGITDRCGMALMLAYLPWNRK